MVKFVLVYFLYFIMPLYSLNTGSLQFEDLMGDLSLIWYNLSDSDQEDIAFFKKLFLKNNEASIQNQAKIPNTLHWIWLGPNPFPEKSKKKLVSWQALHQTWTMKFWTDHPERGPPIPGMEVHSIYSLPPSPISHLISKACNYGEQSDLIRYIILFNEGGVYVDHDILAVKSFDTINKQYDFYAYLETPLDIPAEKFDSNIRINNGLVGVKPGHIILKKTMQYVSDVWNDYQIQYPSHEADTQLIRTLKRTFLVFTKAVIEGIDQADSCDIIFPACFACPRFGFISPLVKKQLKQRSLIYAYHSHDSLWLTDGPKTKSIKTKFLDRKSTHLILYIVITMSSLLVFLFYNKKLLKRYASIPRSE